LAIDITGPHPLSGKGNRFIITVIDHFSKYAFAFPVRNHEARTVAKYLVERVFLVHGVPLQLLSDRGAEFEEHIFREICELLGVDKLRTTAYKPSTNGALERMHRTLNTMLGKVVDDKQRDWDVHVAYVMTAYNATVHSATGFTPNRLVFGREMRYPNELMYVGVRSPKWQNFYSGPYLIVELLGMVNVRIQKSAKASAMVVHVDKIKMCKGEVPNSWIGEPEERLSDRVEPGAFINLFNDYEGVRDAEIVNDIENDLEEEEKRARPKRNAQMPARYIQRIYALNVVNKNYDCCRDDFREVEGFGPYEDVESVEGEADEKDRIEVA